MTERESDAVDRLALLAMRSDSGQARRVADFLLAWWNPELCGRFDMTDAWSCDDDIVEDMVTVFGFIARHKVYADTLGYQKQFEAIVAAWRPNLG